MNGRPEPLRIGTRRSRLARWQADHVAQAIASLQDAPPTEFVFITTEGDQITDVPLHQLGGKAFFTKEIEQSLVEAQVDVAVHSLKDLATVMPDGLALGAVLQREDPRDVLISRNGQALADLPAGASIGTSSLRRRALVARSRPDLRLADLRGNVPTRIRKLHEGAYDAIVLAAAGVKRLGFDAEITEYLEPAAFLPAVSQGAIGIQVRSGDDRTARWVSRLEHADTRAATTAERALLRRLEGGCQVPVGALAEAEGPVVRLRGIVASVDGAASVEGEAEGPREEAENLGTSLADDLVRRGADRILAQLSAAR